MIKRETPFVIEIDGKRIEISPASIAQVECHPVGKQVYQMHSDSGSHHIEVILFDMISGHCTVRIDGKTREVKIMREIDVQIEKMGLHQTHQKKQSILQAPMPGLVTDIKVKPGDLVEKGDALMIMEAMKMENIITAPHEATISKILVQIGQAVERGLPLIEFAPVKN